MGTILFVHGTGVRQANYEETFKTLGDWINKQPVLQDFTLERCLWGPVHGARLLEHGSSIPGYSGKASTEPEDEVMKWWLLYQNPYFELESLRKQGNGQIPPNARNDWKTKSGKIAGHQPSAIFEQLLRENRLNQLWQTALRIVMESKVWTETLPPKGKSAGQFFPVFCQCTAEAVMAETALAALTKGIPVPTAEIRNQIVEQFVLDLEAKVMGAFDWFAALGEGIKNLSLMIYAGGDYAVSKVIKTPLLRNFVTDNSLESISDILFYQAHGQVIRDFIEGTIRELEPPVFLLAHSLGGIACVDLLVLKKELRVAGLITAGSQSPLFYEMGCLVSLPRTREAPDPQLPDYFPPWLNFHDPNDYLSYAAEKVFNSDPRIADCEITSRQPRFMAHSAYWSEKKLWDRLADFIKEQ